MLKKVAPIFEFFPLCYYIMDEPIKTKVMINNKALVYSYVAKMFADGTKYHESIKESDNIGYIYDAVEELLNTKLTKQERKELPLDVQIIRLTERTKDDYDTQLIIAAYLLMTVAPQL